MHGLILTGFGQLTNQLSNALYKRTAGAHRLATYLREQGWDIEVLDFLLGWKLEELKEFTRSRVNSKTVFIGWGGTFPAFSHVIAEYFAWVKEQYPHITVIAGGQVIGNINKLKADWYIEGFGERAMDALLRHLAGTSTEKLKYQLGYDGRKVIKGNLDYPSFPMSRLTITYEDRDFILPNETLVTELGRGCRFRCSFCNFPVLGVREDHSRDADDLYRELQTTYDKYGVTNYLCSDETINDDSAKLVKFAGAVSKLSFRPRLFGYIRPDLLVKRKHDWNPILEMGLVGHHYGIESTNPKTLKSIGKGMNPDKLMSGLLEARSYFKSHGKFSAQMTLIGGLPYETKESFANSLKWMHDNWKKESIVVLPLYIPRAGNTDTPSLLTDDWNKLGYRESSVDLYEIAREKYDHLVHLGIRGASKAVDGISWETDEWNVLDTMEIIDHFYRNNFVESFTPPIWYLGDYEVGLNRSHDELYEKTFAEIAGTTDPIEIYKMGTASSVQVREYVKKKLNWTPN